jgi:hypothetical protein
LPKSDDSSLKPDELRAVEERARLLLDRADAWDRFPIPIDDLLGAAKVTVAPHSMFDPAQVLAYIKGKAETAAHNIKTALSKIWGIYDASESLIHIDDSVVQSKQTFLMLHETGHHDLPWHKKMFRIFQDCEQMLHPDIADQFEREANNFARFALFKGDRYQHMAADLEFGLKTPMKLAKTFGASLYASVREFARTNARACVVYVLERPEFVPGDGFRAEVRRIEPSPRFQAEFGKPQDVVITPTHTIGKLVPIGRKMTRPTTLMLTDLNGDQHECVGEAFDTTYNILVLVYPVKALNSTTIILN